MLIKAGVDISRLRPEIRKRLTLLEEWCREENDELIITSTYEGTHSAGSLHYANLAIDIRFPKRTWLPTPKSWEHIFSQDYDIVICKDHIHIEYDPK